MSKSKSTSQIRRKSPLRKGAATKNKVIPSFALIESRRAVRNLRTGRVRRLKVFNGRRQVGPIGAKVFEDEDEIEVAGKGKEGLFGFIEGPE